MLPGSTEKAIIQYLAVQNNVTEYLAAQKSVGYKKAAQKYITEYLRAQTCFTQYPQNRIFLQSTKQNSVIHCLAAHSGECRSLHFCREHLGQNEAGNSPLEGRGLNLH